jgi:hypothetical protein
MIDITLEESPVVVAGLKLVFLPVKMVGIESILKCRNDSNLRIGTRQYSLSTAVVFCLKSMGIAALNVKFYER